MDGGNGRVDFATRNDSRVIGRVDTEAREDPFNETELRCDLVFDPVVGRPKQGSDSKQFVERCGIGAL